MIGNNYDQYPVRVLEVIKETANFILYKIDLRPDYGTGLQQSWWRFGGEAINIDRQAMSTIEHWEIIG